MDLKNNVVVRYVYSFLFHISLGKRPLSHIIGHLSEFGILLIVLNNVFDVNLKQNIYILVMIYILTLVMFAVIGYVYKQFGFQHAEDYYNTYKSPVANEQLSLIRNIWKVIEHGNRKDKL